MPHKHTRREKDLSTYDLPPSKVAKPLPVKSQSQKSQKSQKNVDGKQEPDQTGKTLKRKRDGKQKDDVPRAFKRLMAYANGKKPRSGLDNGDGPVGKKKNKKAVNTSDPDAEIKAKPESQLPTIRPGERMSEFAARVDQELPVGGLINKTTRNGKDPLGLKVWRTKKEMKMHKMYDEWREDEQKIKEKREEDLELEAEKELEEEEAGVKWKLDSQGGGKKKKGKKAKYLGEAAEAEEDPWEALKKKRGETRAGLHDVVQAPPEFTVKPQKVLTVRGAAVEVDGIPKAAGSLRRREELQVVRDDIVASYRKMMSDKRPSLHKS